MRLRNSTGSTVMSNLPRPALFAISFLQDLDCCDYLLRRMPLAQWDIRRNGELDKKSI
jgi:hypothetical protein